MPQYTELEIIINSAIFVAISAGVGIAIAYALHRREVRKQERRLK